MQKTLTPTVLYFSNLIPLETLIPRIKGFLEGSVETVESKHQNLSNEVCFTHSRIYTLFWTLSFDGFH